MLLFSKILSNYYNAFNMLLKEDKNMKLKTLAGIIGAIQYILLGVLLCGVFPNVEWGGRIALIVPSIILVLMHNMVCESIQEDLEKIFRR